MKMAAVALVYRAGYGRTRRVTKVVAQFRN